MPGLQNTLYTIHTLCGDREYLGQIQRYLGDYLVLILGIC